MCAVKFYFCLLMSTVLKIYITGISSTQINYNYQTNITVLLDNLLQNYDNKIRPDFGGKPIIVQVDIMIRSMGPISEIDMTYSMDCYFRQSWIDRRLAFNGTQKSLALSVSMLARIWRPDTYFYNGKQSYLHTLTAPNKFVRIQPDGRVLYSSRLTIKAGCPMNLENFPMDIQKCPLRFGSFGYTTTDLIYRWNEVRPAVTIADDIKLSQFDLIHCPTANLTEAIYKVTSINKTNIVSHNTSLDVAANQSYHNIDILKSKQLSLGYALSTENDALQTAMINSQYSTLIVHFYLQRHMGNFLIQVYGPCCLLVILSWVSFWLNREATADRVSLGITTILSMTFLGLETRIDLPKVSYPTALDYFVFISFSFIFATILQFAVVHYFTKYGSGECYFITDDIDSHLKPTPSSSSSGYEKHSNFNSNHFRTKYRTHFSANKKNISEIIPLTISTISISNLPTSTHVRRAVQKSQSNQLNPFSGMFSMAPSSHLGYINATQQSGRRRMSFYRREEMRLRRKGHRAPQYNSVSKIDKFSRFVFPALFFTINLFYWYCYLNRNKQIFKAS